MTIEGWSLDTAWKGLSYVGGKLMEYTKQGSNEDDEPDTQVEAVDLTKLVESISGSIFIGMLVMMPEQTKIHVEDNSIKFDAPWLLQGWYRTGVASRKDFKKYKIFHRCITMPQSWYSEGSEEAIAIARIHRITILGMGMVGTMYKDDYVPDHVKKYTKSAKRFISKNGLEEIDVDQSPSMKHEQEIQMSIIEQKLQQDSTLVTDFEKELQQNQKSETEQQTDLDYNSDDDLLSEISDEDKSTAEFAMDSRSSNIMKSLYSKKELVSFADRLETAWEHFQSGDKLVKEQVTGELKAITQSLVTKVRLYQKKMNQDLMKRY